MAVVIALLVLTALDLIVSVSIWLRLFRPGAEEKLEAAVETAREREAEDARGRELQEGFENLMRYSVNGMTGFEQQDAGG